MQIAGAGAPGILLSFLLEAPIFYLSLKYELLPMGISFRFGFLLGCLFLIAFLGLSLWAFKSLPPEKRGKILVKEGPYKYIRHPSYMAKIFFLLPSLAFFFQVWLPILSIPLLLLLWYPALIKEEKELKKSFGDEFKRYCQKTGRFFPWPKG